MSLEVVADRRLQTRTTNHETLKTFIECFDNVEPILGVLG